MLIKVVNKDYVIILKVKLKLLSKHAVNDDKDFT